MKTLRLWRPYFLSLIVVALATSLAGLVHTVVAARDFPPSRFLSLDWSKGGAIILAGGSPTSHVAMLARARGVPMIVGLGISALALSGEALVDGRSGEAVIEASPETERSLGAVDRGQRNASQVPMQVQALSKLSPEARETTNINPYETLRSAYIDINHGPVRK